MTCALLVGVLASCSPAGESSDGEPAAFLFGTTVEVSLDVRVMRGGQPVRGASITITEPYVLVRGTEDSAREAVGETLFQGGTRTDGACQALITVPARFPVVDLVVHVPGMRGPYTNEELRTKWGPFAPSARISVALEDLKSVTVQLEEQQ